MSTGRFTKSVSTTDGLISRAATNSKMASTRVDEHDTNSKKQVSGLGEGHAGSNELLAVAGKFRERKVLQADQAAQAQNTSIKSKEISGTAATQAIARFGNRG